MADLEQLPAVPTTPVNSLVKLAAFWPANSAAWFSSVEGIFELHGITSQRAQYLGGEMAQRRKGGSMDRRRGGSMEEERWLNGRAPDCKSVVLGSNPAPPQYTANSVIP
jgi:hypothetical protein